MSLVGIISIITQKGIIQQIKNLIIMLVLFCKINKIKQGKKVATGHIEIDNVNKWVPGQAPWLSWPLFNLLKKSSRKAFCKKIPFVASSIAKNHGRMTKVQIKKPKIGLKDFIKVIDFWIIQKAMSVGNNIAIESGPFTRTPKENANHTMVGYRYLTLKLLFLSKIIFSKKYCWTQIKHNRVASVLARWASPINAIDDANNNVTIRVW